MKLKRCMGIKVDGKRCSKRLLTLSDAIWCNNHNQQKNLGNCGICLDAMTCGDSIIFQCNHIFHRECAKSLRDIRCPVCRTPIESKDLSQSELITMENRYTEDKKERESVIQYPFDSQDSDEIDIIIPEYDNVMDIYVDLINSYLNTEEYVPATEFIYGIIGSIVIFKNLLGLTDELDIIAPELTNLVKEIYPEQDADITRELIHRLIT